mmetsp:Transcript_67430/g.206499  ORF Transcript_67430/g.206499 Transcript_67430/m.206499 type:complete len:243 (+) Transcript_67430:402-1130(+)
MHRGSCRSPQSCHRGAEREVEEEVPEVPGVFPRAEEDDLGPPLHLRQVLPGVQQRRPGVPGPVDGARADRGRRRGGPRWQQLDGHQRLLRRQRLRLREVQGVHRGGVDSRQEAGAFLGLLGQDRARQHRHAPGDFAPARGVLPHVRHRGRDVRRAGRPVQHEQAAVRHLRRGLPRLVGRHAASRGQRAHTGRRPVLEGHEPVVPAGARGPQRRDRRCVDQPLAMLPLEPVPAERPRPENQRP